MKYYIINHRDNEMEGHQSSLDETLTILISMMIMMMMPKTFLRCSFSFFVFYYDF